ncbi:MAG: hypothetical protein ACE37F_01135 [Nannocystaceae bacterium]|nr:hypothetical protein [bacterium]
MMRAAALVLLLALGCNATHIAAIAEESQGGSGGGSVTGEPFEPSTSSEGSTSVDTTATSTEPDETTAEPCVVPSPLENCDAAADALRAPEILCYDDVAAVDFASTDSDAWRRARELGNAHWVSTESEAVLVLSTGTLPSPGRVGEVNVEPGSGELSPTDNANPDGVGLPADIDPQSLGSAFSGQADDLLWFRFDATAPPGARGYTIRVGFLSAAYPEDLQADVSDLFVWWHESEAFVGNLATWQGRPASVAGLGPRLHAFRGEHPMLLRTGIDGTTGAPCEIEGESVDCPIGAASGWMNLRGPAEPGEAVHVVAALFDQGPQNRDTLVVLDGFRWECEGCSVGISCGLDE